MLNHLAGSTQDDEGENMNRAGRGWSRRAFLGGMAGVAGLGALRGRAAWAAGYPERGINIVIPTRAGGGADRDVRTFAKVWTKYLKTTLTYDFFPGAAGQVGYEIYLGKRDPDCYNLLFGNMGPEVIMYALQKPNYKFPGDLTYIAQTSSETMAVFVGKNSPIQSIQQLVDQGKKRTVTIAVSRLPHPASIGCLALAEATGAKFNLVPYGGGGPSARAGLSGETDAVALPIAQPIKLGAEVRTLCVFTNKNRVPDETNNAPPVNSVFGTKIPELTSSRGFGLHTAAMDKHPDRVALLKQSVKQVFDDPDYPKAVLESGLPTAFIDYGDQDVAMATAMETLELARRYESLLSAKRKG
jgi:tripartite-type tricarboxylate transporter receptor subunit TctC